MDFFEIKSATGNHFRALYVRANNFKYDKALEIDNIVLV